MACTLTAGRKEPCKDSVGGIKEVYFLNFGAITITSSVDDTITSLGSTPSAYKWEVRDSTSNLTENITSSRDNGTTYFEQVLSLTFKKLSYEDNADIKTIAYGRPHIVVRDYNDNYRLIGQEYGCDVTGGTIVTGAAMGDLSGYTLTLTGMERLPGQFILGTFSSLVTIVSGTNS
jgi:hypothetical protein